MKAVFVHASVATFLSVVVPLIICWATLSATGATLEGFAIAMCIICVTLVVFPVSAYNYDQKRKMAAAHDALAEAHAQLASMHRKLSEKARRDEMTGLLNRATFIATVDEMQAREQWGSLLIIDADKFKHINDTYGHLQGDEALRLIAGAIKSAVRGSDIKGRLGGEEFGVFVPGASFEDAFAVAERIRNAVESLRFRPDGDSPLMLTVSIGVAAARTGSTFSDLMGEADQRLYEAKRRGRNVVIMPPRGMVAA